jgi:hypothetical protein
MVCEVLGKRNLVIVKQRLLYHKPKRRSIKALKQLANRLL